MEKDILEAKASGERTLRRAGTSVTSLLPLTGRKPKKPLTPEELEERRKKVTENGMTSLLSETLTQKENFFSFTHS